MTLKDLNKLLFEVYTSPRYFMEFSKMTFSMVNNSKIDKNREWYITDSLYGASPHYVLIHKDHLALVWTEINSDKCEICSDKIPETLLLQYRIMCT